MGLLSFLRSVYTLDTLDTRFTTPSSTSYRTVIESRGDPGPKDGQKERIAARASPSKWKTPEFYLYYLVFAICIPLMFWIPYTVSRRMYAPACFSRTASQAKRQKANNKPHLPIASDPRYHKFEHRLSEGWLPGRKIVSSLTRGPSSRYTAAPNQRKSSHRTTPMRNTTASGPTSRT